MSLLTSQPILAQRNKLLNVLPLEVYARLLPKLEPVPLIFKQVLYQPGEPIEYIYFPLRGVVSLLTILVDSPATEVGLVGNEGIVGISVFLGIDTTPTKAIVQIPGEAMRMQIADFKAEKAGSPRHNLLERYTLALMNQISQSVACNQHHSIEERCCRWLLMSHEQANSGSFPITQEFLSHMLGVRRASVTVVAGMLQKAGLIRYSRGQMTILDPPESVF
ncbi:MAG: Crp/Fnr family transcriptional regulator [Gloeocapsa sp. UFS-A4-WI-NPMV-4B04]|jgi:CRP-like cAMP-binding protein|nr:Crp/Fnr family transcriptional regulator [Gloeocapsa sp. UFS-A4-WI-NPMV-4B04]